MNSFIASFLRNSNSNLSKVLAFVYDYFIVTKWVRLEVFDIEGAGSPDSSVSLSFDLNM